MRTLLLFAVAASLAVPVAAAPPQSHRSDNLASMLGLRLRSIELQIDILSDRDAIGREQARELRADARRLGQRVYRASEREAREVELAVDRLQEQLRLASDVARAGTYASARRDLGRFDDGERYQRDDDHYFDRDLYQRPDPRGDPFAIWRERDERGAH